LKVGIVGIGSIGGTVAKELDSGKIPGIELVALSARNRDQLETFSKTLSRPVDLGSLSTWVAGCDLVIEASGAVTVDEIVRTSISNGKDVMILSVGALIENERLMQLAEEANKRIHIPSGAIAGLDGIKAAALSEIQEIKIVNRKPPSALRGSPGAEGAPVNLDSLTKPYTLFSGTVAEGYRLFPANVNVAVAVSLAGIGVEKTKMEVVADPDISVNIHEIMLNSSIGRMHLYIEGKASDKNPRTSASTPFSVLSYLKQMVSTIRVGT
jgi:aspartate dehydrogenase